VGIWYQTLLNSSQAPQRRLQIPLSTLQPQACLTPPSDMYATLHYLVSLALVLTNCLSPVNWKYCLPVHEWLPPYINDYTDYMGKWS